MKNKIFAIGVVLLVIGVVISAYTQPQVLLAPSYMEERYTMELDITKYPTNVAPTDRYTFILNDPAVKRAYDIAYEASPEGADTFLYIVYVSDKCPDVGTAMQTYSGDQDISNLVSSLNTAVDKCSALTYKEKVEAHNFINQHFALKKMTWLEVGLSCALGVASGGWYWVPCGVTVACSVGVDCDN